jgi:hypothetical protein
MVGSTNPKPFSWSKFAAPKKPKGGKSKKGGGGKRKPKGGGS